MQDFHVGYPLRYQSNHHCMTLHMTNPESPVAIEMSAHVQFDIGKISLLTRPTSGRGGAGHETMT